MYPCPSCSKNTFEKINKGYYKCSSCGYEAQSPSLSREYRYIKFIDIVTAFFVLLPLLVYMSIIFALSILALETILGVKAYFNINKIEDVILFAVLFLALIDLTFLACKYHLRPVVISFLGLEEPSEQRSLMERTYMVRLAVIGSIVILMGVFAGLFRCGAGQCTDMELVTLAVSLFGIAMVLIAIGIWEKYDSEAKK
jgi:hypothetical protein